MTSEGAPAIELEGLGKDYGGVAALHALDLDVRPGEVFGFLGPNGAGKTTTIKILTGLLRPTRGVARVGGFDLATEPSRAKALVGYVPDEPFLYDKLTGDEYLAFVAGLWEVAPERARTVAAPFLERLGLTGVRGELIEGYSHGMRHKLVLVGALVHEPRVLVVDEPTVGLDPRSVRTIKELFREHAARGGSVFLSTHSLGVAEAACDRIAILHKGSLIAQGTWPELRDASRRGHADLESLFLALTEEEEGDPWKPS